MLKQIGYLQASVRFKWLVIDQVLFCVFMDREEEVNKNGAQYLAILTEQFFRDQRGKSRRAGNRPILSTRVANQNTLFALSYFFSLFIFSFTGHVFPNLRNFSSPISYHLPFLFSRKNNPTGLRLNQKEKELNKELRLCQGTKYVTWNCTDIRSFVPRHASVGESMGPSYNLLPSLPHQTEVT